MFEKVNVLCLAHQRAYGFEVPSSAEPFGKIQLPLLGTSHQDLLSIVSWCLYRTKPNPNIKVFCPQHSGLLMPHCARVRGPIIEIELYAIRDCVNYSQNRIEKGTKFVLNISNDVYNREVTNRYVFRALRSFTLECEYLVWLYRETVPFRLWLEERGLVEKLPAYRSFFHDPKTLELL